ncbi:hypothetical protein DY000_02020534 [Brassica cretica]|uniref:Protein TSSC4 n=1 Tax=Brassica cretica TaxID=69181 RepID=A0ABQ7EAR6_BRACR|nr:hypothetical protein DY000_02020534 [Brassica cretica]
MMKRGFLGYSKKKPADSLTIRKSTREESIDTLQAASIDSVNQKSIDNDIVDSAQKNTDVSSCYSDLDVEKEIIMEDFLELEEFLELEDGGKLEDLDSSREVIMEDFLELEEWLEDMDQNSKKKLDDDQHTSRGDLETSKARIDRHQPDEIDRQPPHIIDLHPPDIDRHRQPLIDRHHPPNRSIPIARPSARTPPIWIEEAAGLHKRVKRLHDPVKIMVPCTVFEAESPIPPDRRMQFSSYIEVLDDHQHVEVSKRGLRFRDEVDKVPADATSIDTDQIPSNDINKLALINTTTSSSIAYQSRRSSMCVEILGM